MFVFSYRPGPCSPPPTRFQRCSNFGSFDADLGGGFFSLGIALEGGLSFGTALEGVFCFGIALGGGASNFASTEGSSPFTLAEPEDCFDAFGGLGAFGMSVAEAGLFNTPEAFADIQI